MDASKLPAFTISPPHQKPCLMELLLLSRWFWPAMLGMIAAALAIHASMPFNSDSAVHVMQAQRILRNGEFYPHIYDANMPLIWWLQIPAVLLSQWLGLAIPFAAKLWGIIICSLTFLLSIKILKHTHPSPLYVRGVAWVLMLIYFWLPMSGANHYMQKEVLMVWLSVPYLLLFILRYQGFNVTSPRWLLWLAGSACAIGNVVKPVYFPAIMLLELALLLRLRGRFFLRPELHGALTVGTILCLVLYLVIPWETYSISMSFYRLFAIRQDLLLLSSLVIASHASLILCFLLLARKPDGLVVWLLAAAAIAFGMVMYQGRLFAYHYIPYMAFIAMAAAVLAFRPWQESKPYRSQSLTHSSSFFAQLLILTLTLQATIAMFSIKIRADHFEYNISLVNEQTCGELFYNFGSCLVTNFPYVHYANLQHDYIMHAMWMVSEESAQSMMMDVDLQQDMKTILRDVADDVIVNKPALILIKHNAVGHMFSSYDFMTALYPPLADVIESRYAFESILADHSCDRAMMHFYRLKPESEWGKETNQCVTP